MRKYLILTILMIFLTPICNAQSRSFKVYSPNPHNYYHPNIYNQNLPPPPPPRELTKAEKRYLNQLRRNQIYNNQYYYNSTRQKIRNGIGTLLGGFGTINGGQITGITPSFSSNFNNDWDSQPYGYQRGWIDSNGNYYYNNYGQQTGTTVRILD